MSAAFPFFWAVGVAAATGRLETPVCGFASGGGATAEFIRGTMKRPRARPVLGVGATAKPVNPALGFAVRRRLRGRGCRKGWGMSVVPSIAGISSAAARGRGEDGRAGGFRAAVGGIHAQFFAAQRAGASAQNTQRVMHLFPARWALFTTQGIIARLLERCFWPACAKLTVFCARGLFSASVGDALTI